jgi:hypothetical protein
VSTIFRLWTRSENEGRDPDTWTGCRSNPKCSPQWPARLKARLYLRFRSGDVYRYFGFPPEQLQEFLDAESHGRYFLNRIKGKFRYERLARLTLVGIT